MILFLPACGDRLTLTAPWTFPLYLERRNVAFAKARGLVPKDFSYWGGYVDAGGRRELRREDATLRAGEVVECDRVYVRGYNKSRLKLSNDYDSVTWKVLGPKGKVLTGQRFWAKLVHCNGMEFELAPDALYRDRVKLFKEIMEG